MSIYLDRFIMFLILRWNLFNKHLETNFNYLVRFVVQKEMGQRKILWWGINLRFLKITLIVNVNLQNVKTKGRSLNMIEHQIQAKRTHISKGFDFNNAILRPSV